MLTFTQFMEAHTPEEHDTVRWYKSNSADVNGPLRNRPEHPVTSSVVKHLDRITSTPTKKAMVLHRGLNHNHTDYKYLKPGDEFTDNGFHGTTLNPHIAKQHSTIDGDGARHFSRIHLPKGGKAGFLGTQKNDHYSHEKEVLLPRQTTFRLIKHTKEIHNGSVHHIHHLSVVHQPVHKPTPKWSAADDELLKALRENAEETYHGEHSSPDPESGAPMHDLKGTYPADIYSAHGSRYYGDGRSYDNEAVGHIQRVKDKPNRQVKIYRAVPYEKTNHEHIAHLEKHQAHILKYGKIPHDVVNASKYKNHSDYYDHTSKEVERRKALPPEPKQIKKKINPGDWVTTTSAYAHEHGKGNLKNNYKVVSKVVPAKHLYTTGDSVHEWGYHP